MSVIDGNSHSHTHPKSSQIRKRQPPMSASEKQPAAAPSSGLSSAENSSRHRTLFGSLPRPVQQFLLFAVQVAANFGLWMTYKAIYLEHKTFKYTFFMCFLDNLISWFGAVLLFRFTMLGQDAVELPPAKGRENEIDIDPNSQQNPQKSFGDILFRRIFPYTAAQLQVLLPIATCNVLQGSGMALSLLYIYPSFNEMIQMTTPFYSAILDIVYRSVGKKREMKTQAVAAAEAEKVQRQTTPLCSMLAKWVALGMIVGGGVMSAFGEVNFHPIGFACALTAAVVRSVRLLVGSLVMGGGGSSASAAGSSAGSSASLSGASDPGSKGQPEQEKTV
eukprot:Hpha_TRINITY_DN9238_c0_g3::TRINITY_DN9238_c0_g3_i1::g.28491::m.28491